MTNEPTTTDPNRREFWDQHPGLVWSNPDAPDDAFIAAALRKGRFLQLLDIAAEFGLARILQIWESVTADGDLSPHRVNHIEDILTIFKSAHDRTPAACDSATVEPA